MPPPRFHPNAPCFQETLQKTLAGCCAANKQPLSAICLFQRRTGGSSKKIEPSSVGKKARSDGERFGEVGALQPDRLRLEQTGSCGARLVS